MITAYASIARLTLLRLMAYRMRFVTGIATYAIFVGGQWFIWKAIYAARGPGAEVGGMDLAQLTTYLAVGYIARSAYFTNLDSDIAGRFQNGDVALDLLKPINPMGQWLALAAGECAFRILFFALPMACVLVPVFGVHPPSGDGWWQFPILFLLAFLINHELNVAAGIACFFLEDVTALTSLKRNLIMLLSGLMVPLHMLPSVVASAVAWLPFAVISYWPMMAYVGELGQHGHPGFAQVAALGLGWLGLLHLGNRWLWSRARGRLEVQGG
ncbi:MAG: ABC-2 family transporter protein [Planctomycetes bacterium]|nr:ABC-2 family transporter protein [Planctomycetota bacterium]